MTHQTKSIKIFFISALVIAVGLFVAFPPELVGAANISINPIDASGEWGNLTDTGLGTTDPVVVASQIINILLRVLGLFSLIVMLYGGWLWIWARGNEETISKAKDILVGTFIGLIIILASYGILQWVFYYLADITNAGGGASA
ncbi:MAG: hypothetical protein Q8P90_05285 [bacterium]|nr:hypothetical protein [bacterium]